MSALEPERQAERAALVLSRAGAWLEPLDHDYAVRQGPDRRRRPLMRIDEAAFTELVSRPGLKPRGEGGYTLASRHVLAEPLPPGRPGIVEGERGVVDETGVVRSRRANLGKSPIAWLARRKDSQGVPWLTAREAAAGERLREDFIKAGTIGRLTMDWSGGPRRRGGGAAASDPVDRAIQAKARVRAAMLAVGPGLDAILERVCLAGSALDAAERDLGLPRRAGKAVLKLALQRLAAHYGI